MTEKIERQYFNIDKKVLALLAQLDKIAGATIGSDMKRSRVIFRSELSPKHWPLNNKTYALVIEEWQNGDICFNKKDEKKDRFEGGSYTYFFIKTEAEYKEWFDNYC